MKFSRISSLILFSFFTFSVFAQLSTVEADSAMMRSPGWSYEFRKPSGSPVYGLHLLFPTQADSGVFLVDFHPNTRREKVQPGYSVAYIPNNAVVASWRSDSIVSVFYPDNKDKPAFLDKQGYLYYEYENKIRHIQAKTGISDVLFAGEKIYLLKYDSAKKNNELIIHSIRTEQEKTIHISIPLGNSARFSFADAAHAVLTDGKDLVVFNFQKKQVASQLQNIYIETAQDEKYWISRQRNYQYDSLFVQELKPDGKLKSVPLQHQFRGKTRNYLLLDSSVIVMEIIFHNGIADSCEIRAFNRKSGKENYELDFKNFSRLTESDDLSEDLYEDDLFSTIFFLPAFGNESTFCLVEHDEIVKFNTATGDVINHFSVFGNKTWGRFSSTGEVDGLFFFFKTEYKKTWRYGIIEYNTLFVYDPVRDRYRDIGNEADRMDYFTCSGKYIYRIRQSAASIEIDRFSPTD